ncbi:MAG: hypothetical protein DRP06_02295 [Candidatus Aenigmatarchaeota archaeon]|nr:MAG: hypothetical protein DRP06_02295 [Candidatus Aenigmarchaeota archaeon]
MGDKDELEPRKELLMGDSKEGILEGRNLKWINQKGENSKAKELLEKGKIDEALEIAGKGDIEILDKKANEFCKNKNFSQDLEISDKIIDLYHKISEVYYN